jgi:hypothetical protein
LVGEGLIGAWGLTGIGHPDTIIKLLGEGPKVCWLSAGGRRIRTFDPPLE